MFRANVCEYQLNDYSKELEEQAQSSQQTIKNIIPVAKTNDSEHQPIGQNKSLRTSSDS